MRLKHPSNWINFDASPTLLLQKIPVINILLKPFFKVRFPKIIKYGDIINGLPVKNNLCDGIYCSHVLEHLAYTDFIKALENTYAMLKPDGTFRLVMPDLEQKIEQYVTDKKQGTWNASITFIESTGMTSKTRAKGIRAFVEQIFGNSKHLWLWDYDSTIQTLKEIGFRDIRKCKFNDSKDPMFQYVEDKNRFEGSIALEMTK